VCSSDLILVPVTAGALSASGAQFADIVTEFSVSKATDTKTFDFGEINRVVDSLNAQIDNFAEMLIRRSGLVSAVEREFLVEARYPAQVWELEVELPQNPLLGERDLRALEARFHEVHERTFAVNEPGQYVECQQWRGRLTAKLRTPKPQTIRNGTNGTRQSERQTYFGYEGETRTRCIIGASQSPGMTVNGPAILEEPTMTVVIPPGARAEVTPYGNFLISTGITHDR